MLPFKFTVTITYPHPMVISLYANICIANMASTWPFVKYPWWKCWFSGINKKSVTGMLWQAFKNETPAMCPLLLFAWHLVWDLKLWLALPLSTTLRLREDHRGPLCLGDTVPARQDTSGCLPWIHLCLQPAGSTMAIHNIPWHSAFPEIKGSKQETEYALEAHALIRVKAIYKY